VDLYRTNVEIAFIYIFSKPKVMSKANVAT